MKRLIAFVVTLGLFLGVATWLARPVVPPPAPSVPSIAPVAPVAATEPAPLPIGTGVDGQAYTAPPVAPVQVVPDAGHKANVVVTPPPSEGVGGEVYVASPVFKGRQRLNAGAFYPSGGAHWGWDIGVWRGTPIYASRDGRIVGKHDGVRNQPNGVNAGSGSPSNWILLCANVPGIGPSVLYHQHLSPGLKVKRGQIVKKGTLLGKSGNTGNSSGDHLHLSSSRLPKGWTCNNITPSRAEYLRYDYLRTPSRRNFAPSKFWINPKPAAPKPPVSAAGARKACATKSRTANFRYVRSALGIKFVSDLCGPGSRVRYAKWQRSLGLKGAAANGVPGPWSLGKLASKSGKFRVVK